MKKQSLAIATILSLGLTVFGGTTSTFAMTEPNDNVTFQSTSKYIGNIPSKPKDCNNVDKYKLCTNKEEADAWGKKQFSKWSKEEKSAIRDYTKNARPYNEFLRMHVGKLDSDPTMKKKIESLDKALNRKEAKVNDNIKVYRGDDAWIFGKEYDNSIIKNGKVDREKFKEIQKKFQGKTITEFGYISTSILIDAGYAKTRPVMTEFKVGSGTHGAYMNSDDLTAYPGQYELLLPRNTVYKIEKIYIAIDNNTQKEQIKVEATIK